MDGMYGFCLINNMLAMSCMVVWLLKQLVKGVRFMVDNLMLLALMKGTGE